MIDGAVAMVKRGRYSLHNPIQSAYLSLTPGHIVQLTHSPDDGNVMDQWLADLKDPQRPEVLDRFCSAGA
jgi:hypothetical protein